MFPKSLLKKWEYIQGVIDSARLEPGALYRLFIIRKVPRHEKFCRSPALE